LIGLRQQIAQMLIIGFDGTRLEPANPLVHCLSHEGLGGVILFDYDLSNQQPGKNLVNQAQIKELTQELQEAAQKNAQNLPLFIAIDYEGGAVDRLKHIAGCPPTVTPENFTFLSPSDQELQLKSMTATLRTLGFNLNFAPVVDLNMNQKEGIIGKLGRSYSSEAGELARIARRFVRAFSQQKIVCCYKHFPGHGSATGDTHQGFVDVTETFELRELEPYRALMQGVEAMPMIMTAHVINRKLDPSGLPATLSQPILTTLLREQIGFDGIIISDDLQMHAISNHFSVEEALGLTINAGADMVIFANQLGKISATEVIDIIEKLVHEEKISEERIQQAYQRITKVKHAQLAPCYSTA